MLGPRGLFPRVTSLWATAFVLLGQWTPLGVGLRTTPGSPCTDTCTQRSTNTTGADIVCLDRQFSDTSAGSNFQQCVECQLRSSFTDSTTGQSDVEWGLYNLRYAFSTCVYGFPESVANLSTPCTVSCQPLDSALEYDLANPSGVNFDTWCGASSFADNLISQCEFCFNLTQTEVYMANFLEALRYNCHFKTPTDHAFPISPSRIFSTSLLPSSTVDLISPSATPGGGISNLALVIALPILGFIILVCTLAVGCFFFIRHRRRQARKRRASGHLHARWNDTTISTPAYGNWGGPQQTYPPGYGPGFGFVDTNGQGHEVGYSKAHYTDVVESPVAVPATMYSPEREKGQAYMDSPPQKGI
ncbi:predicted protein [Aspergillus terreus NIH2624]|uniref:WSC domain-containing protein n=1 Tax=Aspergillus terreus (strain NIH 2624 / FGSC A1156) TaxID=341663 RepID=Q0CLS5_ASPTN|nr:uncharacterized protein ATEG_05359 [Aspergillus terreus NIH2624]EAU34428.1 predicted protein [Aspergillus terreus NIH2624]